MSTTENSSLMTEWDERVEACRARCEVAEDPKTAPDVLAALAEDVESLVRARVAGNPNTPEDVLGALANDDDSLVRLEVPYNSSAPIDVVLRYVREEDIESRLWWAQYSDRLSVLALLGDDRSVRVRRWVAWNSNTPADVLQKLAGSSDSDTAYWARLRLKERADEQARAVAEMMAAA